MLTRMTAQDCARDLATARRLLGASQYEAALGFFQKATQSPATRHDALLGSARCQLALRHSIEAIRTLEIACGLEESNGLTRRNLGLALLASGNPERAVLELERAVSSDPSPEMALLHLGQAYSLLDRKEDAGRAYFRAITTAQTKGVWLDADSTAPHLHAAVLAAMDAVDRLKADALLPLLEGIASRHPEGALVRVERWLAEYLSRRAPQSGDPLQRARFLYFPDISSDVFYPKELFPWIVDLERSLDAIRNEAVDRCFRTDAALVPFLSFSPSDRPSDYLAGKEAHWDASFFFRDGRPHEDTHAACPKTSEVLNGLPLVRIRDHAPEICFSVLGPDSHILPHTGVTNTRLVLHLPLIVPPNCALRVRNVVHEWSEGEIVIFDDTYVHEAWNRSSHPRVVLLMDAWNPNLSIPEREAIAALVEGIGDFHRG